MSIENCLPASARQQYLRVRNQKSESARQSYRTKLVDLRAKSAASGVLRSGYQELAEWNLTEEFLGQFARSWFEAAIETCELYEIPLDQNLCKCIEDGVRELLVAQYQNSLKHTGSGAGGVKMPLSARNQVAERLQDYRFPILNTIQIELEKERVESQRRQRDNMPRSLTPEERNARSVRGKPNRTAIVINVLIASPSDVSEERDVATNAIHSWNAAHFESTGIMLNPIRWETHSFPASGERPQAIINKQIVDRGDLLIGIFGYRVGTPTGAAQSGTIEEIERFRSTGKHVALYFSTADVPRDIDRNQLKALEDYQRERQRDTLYFPFKSADALRGLLAQHLPKIVQEVHAKLQNEGELRELEHEIQSIENNSGEQLAEIAKQGLSLTANVGYRRLPIPGGGDDELYMLLASVENDGDLDATDFQLDVEIPAHYLDGGGHRLQVQSERAGFALFRITNKDPACLMEHLYPGKKTKDLICFNYAIRGLVKFQQQNLLQEKVTATVFSGNMKPKKTEFTIAELMDK